jgi:hypothetical protein
MFTLLFDSYPPQFDCVSPPPPSKLLRLASRVRWATQRAHTHARKLWSAPTLSELLGHDATEAFVARGSEGTHISTTCPPPQQPFVLTSFLFIPTRAPLLSPKGNRSTMPKQSEVHGYALEIVRTFGRQNRPKCCGCCGCFTPCNKSLCDIFV